MKQGKQHSSEFEKVTVESRERVLPAKRGLEDSLQEFKQIRQILWGMTVRAGVKAQAQFKSERQGIGGANSQAWQV